MDNPMRDHDARPISAELTSCQSNPMIGVVTFVAGLFALTFGVITSPVVIIWQASRK